MQECGLIVPASVLPGRIPILKGRFSVQQYDRIIPELVYNERLLLRPVRIKESFL